MQKEDKPVSAGEFLWYLTKIILVVVGFCALFALGTSLVKAQGCPSFEAAVARNIEAFKKMEAQGNKYEYGKVEKAQVPAIIKLATEDGTELPEGIDGLFYAVFPDREVVFLLGKGPCAVGFLKLSGEEWGDIQRRVAGEQATK